MISSSLLTPRHLLVVVLLLAGFADHALFVSFWAGFYGNKKADHDDVGQHSKRSKRGQAKHLSVLLSARSFSPIRWPRRHSDTDEGSGCYKSQSDSRYAYCEQ